MSETSGMRYTQRCFRTPTFRTLLSAGLSVNSRLLTEMAVTVAKPPVDGREG